ncbi:hypothetical protein A1353_20395 [Methylomonas methanica]|uniref:Transmembrane protein n=1 Tax=Methylomonas methanica TaxID=421 RepID=A0A177M3N8_METMH|nr:YfiR family protein [Methylomonas methanica]OAH99689.1 hypothetical protein A1353_20395 [Methylomonas methanica]
MNKGFKKLLRLLLGLGLLFNSQPTTQALTLEEQTVLAALALNVVRFTTWPDQAVQGMKETIDFCVVGDNTVQQSFSSIDHKAVGNKSLKIISLSRLSNFEQCHVLYLTDIKQNILLQVFVEIKKMPLLSIGDSDDFAEQGGMIGLENVNNKITLHVNTAAVREANLTISSRLLSLAKIIDNK